MSKREMELDERLTNWLAVWAEWQEQAAALCEWQADWAAADSLMGLPEAPEAADFAPSPADLALLLGVGPERRPGTEARVALAGGPAAIGGFLRRGGRNALPRRGLRNLPKRMNGQALAFAEPPGEAVLRLTELPDSANIPDMPDRAAAWRQAKSDIVEDSAETAARLKMTEPEKAAGQGLAKAAQAATAYGGIEAAKEAAKAEFAQAAWGWPESAAVWNESAGEVGLAADLPTEGRLAEAEAAAWAAPPHFTLEQTESPMPPQRTEIDRAGQAEAEADRHELAEAVAAILCEDIEAMLGTASFVE